MIRAAAEGPGRLPPAALQRFDVGTLARTDGMTVQTMVFVDTRGRVFEADYEMRLVDGVWRIGGVRLAQAAGGNRLTAQNWNSCQMPRKTPKPSSG